MIRLNASVFFETEAFTAHFPSLMIKDKWELYDYIGTISWKAHIKFTKAFGFGMFNLSDVISSAPDNVDVIALVGQRDAKFDNMLNESTRNHKRFDEIWIGLLQAFNRFTPEQISTHGMIPFYCNYWIAKPQYVARFIPFMKEAHGYLTNLSSIQDALWSNPKYIGNKHVAKVVFGRKYYAYHPFILERLSPFFFNMENRSIYVYKQFVNITQLPKKIRKKKNHEEAGQDQQFEVVKAEKSQRDKIWPIL